MMIYLPYMVVVRIRENHIKSKGLSNLQFIEIHTMYTQTIQQYVGMVPRTKLS